MKLTTIILLSIIAFLALCCLICRGQTNSINLTWNAPTNVTPDFYLVSLGNSPQTFRTNWLVGGTTTNLLVPNAALQTGLNYFAAQSGMANTNAQVISIFSNWSLVQVTPALALQVFIVATNYEASSNLVAWETVSNNLIPMTAAQQFFRARLSYKIALSRTNIISFPIMP